MAYEDHPDARARARDAEIAALTAALAALVAFDPIEQHGSADWACRYCESDASPWASLRQHVVHSETCPWVVACAALKETPGQGRGR